MEQPPQKHPKTPDAPKKEYSFKEGLDACVERIQELMRTLNRDVFVVINGSGTQVGKTRLLGALQQRLTLLGIETEHTNITGNEDGVKKVIFKTTQGLFFNKGEDYREYLEKIGTHGTYGDLYIGTYRPDKKFVSTDHTEPLADIMICVEKAEDRD